MLERSASRSTSACAGRWGVGWGGGAGCVGSLSRRTGALGAGWLTGPVCQTGARGTRRQGAGGRVTGGAGSADLARAVAQQLGDDRAQGEQHVLGGDRAAAARPPAGAAV